MFSQWKVKYPTERPSTVVKAGSTPKTRNTQRDLRRNMQHGNTDMRTVHFKRTA
jgi:hypothetical protein